ncbi:MAG TPA: peptide deformylase [Syntrophobacteria bacterium]|nr:peptide deformylase [Syntrophobacteria bacterium]
MAVLEICTFPDKVLLQKAEPISAIDREIARLADDMAETMYSAPGIGLAANQVGVPRRLIVIDTSRRDVDSQLIVIVNPEIISGEGLITMEEGCLSVPDYQAEVTRYQKVKVRGLDLQGKSMELDAEGLLAVVLQHEIDHVNGKLFIDHLSRLKRELCKRRMRRRRAKEAS